MKVRDSLHFKNICFVIVYHTILFFFVFGPKIGGVIDTSVLANTIVILYFSAKSRTGLCSYKYQSFEILHMAVIFVYSMIVQFFCRNVEFVFMGRMMRAIISYIAIVELIKNTKPQNIMYLKKAIINILVLHAVVVIMGAFDTDIQDAMNIINGFGKMPVIYRSTGFTSGYDMSGLMCNIGIMMVLTMPEFSIVRFFILALATVFSSRLSVMFCVIELGAYYLFLCEGRISLKNIICGLSIVVGGIFACMMLVSNIIPDYSFLFEKARRFIPRIAAVTITISNVYSRADFGKAFKEHFLLPENPIELIFGGGKYGGVDPGYFRVVSCVGFVGLFLVVVWHFVFFYNIFRFLKQGRTNKGSLYIVFMFMLIIILLDFKNSYFFTRNFFPLLLMITGLVKAERDKMKTICEERR